MASTVLGMDAWYRFRGRSGDRLRRRHRHKRL